MPAGPVRITRLQDARALQRSIRILDGIPGALTRTLERCGELAVRQWRASIKAGRSSYHTFPKLSPAYAEAKRRAVGVKPILVRTGAMFAGLAWKVTHPTSQRYVLLLGASGSDKAGTANGMKVLWAIDGAAGGSRRGRRPHREEWLMGRERRSGRFKAKASTRKAAGIWRRPPRVFTALAPRFFHAIFSQQMVSELRRLRTRR